jgi:molybdate transport system regulatory protein
LAGARGSALIAAMNERLEPRIRILLGAAIAIGPGKAALLQAIEETGSIAAAGRRMGMSYRRAWLLVKSMNDCFRERLVEATKGGNAGGGAELTSTGRDVLRRYRAMEALAAAAVADEMRDFHALLRDQPREEDPQ